MRVRWRGLELPSIVQCDPTSLTSTYGKFTAEPFERGFGSTVGNGLRRILLSIRKLVPGYQAKRFSRTVLARRHYFPALLQVFSIHCRAARNWGGTLREWEEIASRVEPEREPARSPRQAPRGRGPRGGRPRRTGAKPAAVSESGEAGRGRRRRGRRRRPRPTGAASG